MPNIDLSILNQRQTPAFFADTLANRPAAGFLGRIFVSTDTFAFYRDNGTGWDLIGGPGTGTITGSGTTGTIPLWSGASTIGNSILSQSSSTIELKATGTNDAVLNIDTTTGEFSRIEFQNNGNLRARAYWTESLNLLTYGTYLAGGSVKFETGNNIQAIIIDGSQNTTFYGNIIRNGGLSTQFLKANGSLDSNTYNTGSGVAGQVSYWSGTNQLTGNNNLFYDTALSHLGINTNTPGSALDVHDDQSTLVQLNQTIATNDTRIGFQNSGTALWRIGNFYNAGANDWGIFDVVGSAQQFSIKKTTGQTFVGAQTTSSGRLVVNDATGDNHIVVIGASAPSLRINNSGSGATKQIGIGLATATNNFIQGAADRDMAIFNGSTTSSPILFGIYGTTNIQEAARISAARNFLIGTTTDNGQKLQINGNFSSSGVFGQTIAKSGSGVEDINFMNLRLSGTNAIGDSQNINFLNNAFNTISRISNIVGADNVAYGSLAFSTRNYFSDTLVEVMRITNRAYVGISRTNPEFSLDVNGDIAFPRTSKLQFSGGVAGDRQRSYLTGDPNNNIFVYGPSSNLLATFRYTGATIIGNRTTDNGEQLQVQGNVWTSSGTYTTGQTFTISALNTDVPIKSAYSGLIVIRDNTNGGSALWLADPNFGHIQIANNMPGTFSMNYNSFTGLTNIQKNSGSVPINISIGFYSNIYQA
jgi:hypothetical protein